MRAKLNTAIAGFAAAFLGATDATAQNAWDWNAAIYLWGASLDTQTTDGSSVNVSFDTLIKNLNFGGMGALSARRGKWTLFGDFIYLDVEDSEDGSLTFGGDIFDAKVDAKVSSFITTFGAAYSVAETPKNSVNVLGGARYLWLDSDLDARVGSIKESVSDKETSWDAVVGVNGDVDLSERWYLSYYGDIGAGQSDLTWQALASANYRLERVDLTLGYRYLAWQFSDFGAFEKLDVSGPFLGVRFSF